MTDGPFKSMTPDHTSTRADLRMMIVPAAPGSPGLLQPYPYMDEISEPVECDRCGAIYYAGDWPWCKGDRKDHQR